MMLSRTTMTNRMIQIRPPNRLGSFSRGYEWSLSKHGCANRGVKSLDTNRRPERFERDARDARHQACGFGWNGIALLSICWSLRRKQPWMLRFERWTRNNAFVVVDVWKVVGFVSVFQQQPFLLWCYGNCCCCCCCCNFVQPEYLEYPSETIDRAKLFFFVFSR